MPLLLLLALSCVIPCQPSSDGVSGVERSAGRGEESQRVAERARSTGVGETRLQGASEIYQRLSVSSAREHLPVLPPGWARGSVPVILRGRPQAAAVVSPAEPRHTKLANGVKR